MNEWILKYNEKIISNYFKYQKPQPFPKDLFEADKNKNDEIK